MGQSLTPVQLFNKCEQSIKLDIKLGFYNAADRIRMYQGKAIRELEEDVEIFLSNHEVYESDRKMRLNTMYGIVNRGR